MFTHRRRVPKRCTSSRACERTFYKLGNGARGLINTTVEQIYRTPGQKTEIKPDQTRFVSRKTRKGKENIVDLRTADECPTAVQAAERVKEPFTSWVMVRGG